MATCPNCGAKLHFWDVFAECRKCGANIPNHNWEERLEEDNQKAEHAFGVFYKALNGFKYVTVGTKLRIVRLVFSFLPAIGFIVPWYVFSAENSGFTLTIYSLFDSNLSLIDFFTSFFGDPALFLTNMRFEQYSGALSFMLYGIVCYVLSVLMIVLAFFMILFIYKRPKTKVTVVFDVLSIVFCVASAVMMYMAGTQAGVQGSFAFGTTPMTNVTATVGWGLFVNLVLLCVAFVLNVLVSRAKAKTDEELEAERAAKQAAKEAKQEAEEEKKRLAREEAKKKAEEENQKKIAAAKARMAELKREREAKSKKKK